MPILENTQNLMQIPRMGFNNTQAVNMLKCYRKKYFKQLCKSLAGLIHFRHFLKIFLGHNISEFCKKGFLQSLLPLMFQHDYQNSYFRCLNETHVLQRFLTIFLRHNISESFIIFKKQSDLPQMLNIQHRNMIQHLIFL